MHPYIPSLRPAPPLPTLSVSVECASIAPLLRQQGRGAGLSLCFPWEEAGLDEKPWENGPPGGGGAGTSRVLEIFLPGPDSGCAGPWCTSSLALVLLNYF